jgi:LysR family transcriptional regulator, transcription activator of glutamate synthase operon
MELRQLRYYEAVTRHRHFTRAAEELHVAQSALSQQVARLERELGIALLQRTTRSVDVTDAGRLVARRARAILAEADALRADVDALRGLTRGRVRIGALLFGGQLDIPVLLASFIERYPDVDVGLREGTVQRMLEMLMAGSLDLTFALEPPALPDGLERLPVSNEELAVAASPDHRLARRTRLALGDLRGERVIMFEPGASTRERVDAAFAAAGVEPNIALEANDLAFVRALVARGIGLAIMPRSFADLPGPPIAVRPLTPRLRMPVALWWRAGRHLSPAARAFVEFTRAHAPG